MSEFGAILPVLYQLRQRERPSPIVVIVNWLAVEAMPPAALAKYRDVLDRMKGWRNRECYERVSGYDWTAQLYVNRHAKRTPFSG